MDDYRAIPGFGVTQLITALDGSPLRHMTIGI